MSKLRVSTRRVLRLLFLVLLLMGFALTGIASPEWPKFHHDLHNTGYSAAQGAIHEPALRWVYPTENVIWSSPAIGDIDGDGEAEVAIGSNSYAVYAIDGYSGGLEWQYNTGDDIWSSPVLKDVDGVRKVVWNGKTIPAGKAAVLEFQVKVDDVPEGTRIYNQGRANWGADGGLQNDQIEPTDEGLTNLDDDPNVVTVAESVPVVGIEAWKTVSDDPGGVQAPGDTLTYTVFILNRSGHNLVEPPSSPSTNGWNEFEDPIPPQITYVPGSLRVNDSPESDDPTDGIGYDGSKIIWNGNIPDGGLLVLEFQVKIDPGASGDIDNQGTVWWDSNGDGSTDGSEPTDDPATPTINDDPTRITIGTDSIPDAVEAYKFVTDNNGGDLESGDTLIYTILVFKLGSKYEDQQNDPDSNEFEDLVPISTSYVLGSAEVIYGREGIEFRSWNTGTDVVIGSIDGNLYVLNGDDGTRKWSYPTGMIEWSSAAVGDIDQDNELEIVIGTSGGAPNIGGDIYAINAVTGGLEWNYHVLSIVWSSPAIGDIDGDDEAEVVIGTNNGQVIALDGKDGSVDWNNAISAGAKVASSPAIGDIDNDGDMEVVVGCHNGSVYVLDGGTGVVERSFPTGGIVWSSPAIGDIDGDGYLEIVVGSDDGNVYAFEWTGLTGTEEWHYTTGDGVWSSPAIVDIDGANPAGDSDVEIIVGSNDGYIYAINHDGTFLWKYPTGDVVLSSPAIGDIDGDGEVEVVVGSRDGNLYAIDDLYAPQQLEVIKRAEDESGDSKASPGELITYTITINNASGTGALFNPAGPLFVDPIPDYTTYVGCIAGCDHLVYNSSTSPPQVEWNGVINPGETLTIKFQVRADGSLDGVSQICNEGATVTWSGGSQIIPPVCLAVAGEPDWVPDVTAYKTVEGWNAPLYVGDNFIYRIEILNNTGAVISGARFEDELPTEILYDGSCTIVHGGGTCGATADTLTWSGDIPTSGVILEYRVKIDSGEIGDLICNRGWVYWDSDRESQPTTQGCIRIGTDPLSTTSEDIIAFKTVEWDGMLGDGTTLIYTIKIYNISDDTIHINFSDLIPAQTEDPAWPGGGGPAGGEIDGEVVTWDGSIAGGNMFEFQYEVSISTGATGEICNYGEVTWHVGGVEITEPTNLVCAVVGSSCENCCAASVVAYKTATWEGILGPEQDITYHITIINTGSADLVGVHFNDPVPDQTHGDPLEWDGDLDGGGSVSLEFTVTVDLDATGPICNYGTVSWTYNSVNYTVPTNLLCIPLGASGPEASESIVAYKSADWEGALGEGSAITYTITIHNLGRSAQDVHFIDDLPGWVDLDGVANPGDLGFISDPAGDAELDGRTLTWDGMITGGGIATLEFTVTVGEDPPDPLCNYGTVQWPWEDEEFDYVTITNHLCLPLGSRSEEGPGAVTAYKTVRWNDTVHDGVIGAGDQLLYEITIINNSGGLLVVDVTDELPGGVHFGADGEGGTWSYEGDSTYTLSDVEVATGGYERVSFTVVVDIDAGEICNFAEVTWGEGSYIVPTNVVCVRVGCCCGGGGIPGEILAYKTATWEGTLDQYDTLTYHITISNPGSSGIIVNLIDDLPDEVAYLESADDLPGGATIVGVVDGTYTVNNIPISAGETVEHSFYVEVLVNTGEICNFAKVQLSDGYAVLTNRLCIPVGADYSSTMGAVTASKMALWEGDDLPGPGTEITYTVQIENHSPDTIEVLFTDRIPYGTTYSGGDTYAEYVTLAGSPGAESVKEISFAVRVNSDPPPSVCNYGVVEWPHPALNYLTFTNMVCITLGGPLPPFPEDFVLCAPNPVGDEGLVCWFDLPDDTVAAWFKVFDVDGVLLLSYELTPGYARFPAVGRWNPQDDLGRLLANGLYLCLLQVERADGRVSRSRIYKLVVER